MADLNRLLKVGGGAYTTATLKRYVEEVGEPILEQGVRGVLNHNQTLKALLVKLVEDRDSRVSAHAFVSMVGALISEYGDDLWKHRTDPFTNALRFGLKSMAPVMHFASDIGADAIQNALGPEVDKQFAVDPTVPKGLAEGVFGVFVHTDGKRYPLVYDGKTDALGDPVPKNPEIFDVWFDPQYLESKTREVRNSGEGGGTRTDTDPPKKRNYILGLDAAAMVAMVTTQSHIDPVHLERLETLLKPAASWESQISPNVDDVLSWINDAISLPGLDLRAIKRDRQEIEDLLSSMKRQKPNPDWVNRRLGRFVRECKKLKVTRTQSFTIDEISQVLRLIERVCNEIDHTLEGEQSNLTKARHVLRAAPGVLAQGREILTDQLPWIKTVGVWWLLTMVGALVALGLGVLLPSNGTPILAPAMLAVAAIGSFVNMNEGQGLGKVKNQLAWMFIVIAALVVVIAKWTSVPMWVVGIYFSAIGSLLGFAFTWAFKFFQTGLNVLRRWVPEITDDGLNDLGRRIALFAMSTGGVLSVLNWMQMPNYGRVLFIAMVFMSMGTLFGYTTIDRRWEGEQVALRALRGLNWVTTPMMLLILFLTLHGHVMSRPNGPMSGPEFFRWTKTEVWDNGTKAVRSWWSTSGTTTSAAPLPVTTQVMSTPAQASSAGTTQASPIDGDALCRHPKTTYVQKQQLRAKGYNCP